MRIPTRPPLIRGGCSLLLSLMATSLASALPGGPDATFNGVGNVITDDGGYERGNAVAIQSDGKIVVVGDQHYNGDFVVMRYNANGTSDTDFGGGDGIVTTDFPDSVGTDQAFAVAIQADGKIVVVGYTDDTGDANFGIARYLSNGDLDTSFSTDGMANVDFRTTVTDDYEEAKGVVIQADGKIVVVGSTQASGSPPDGGHPTSDFAVARLTTAGVLDTTFSGDGKLTTDFFSNPGLPSPDFAMSVALQPDGKIVVGGEAANFGSSKFAVARYTVSGVLDTTFSTDGKATGPDGFGTAVAVHDGKIILGGYTWWYESMTQDFAVVRFTGAGALDATFNGDGFARVHLGGEDRANALVVEPGGKIIVAGSTGLEKTPGPPVEVLENNRDFGVARFNTNGSLDAGFGTNGFGFITDNIRITSVDDVATGIKLDAGGNLVVVGYSDDGTDDPMPDEPGDPAYDFVVARYEGGEPPAAPEIAVFEGFSTSVEEEIQDGDSISLPGARVGLKATIGTGTILNKGNANLTGISADMAAAGDFTIIQQPASTLLPGQSTTFSVRFAPTSTGLTTGTVEIQSNDMDEATFDIVVRGIVPSVSSDSFVGRVVLASSNTVDVASSNLGATATEPGEPNPGNYSGASVWYQWTPAADGWVTVDTAGSEFDTVLGLFTGTDITALTQLGFNDESFNDGMGEGSRLTFYASASTTYVIGVFGYSSGLPANADTGDFELHIAPAFPDVRITGVTSDTADVTAGADTATVDVTIESDYPLTSFVGSASYTAGIDGSGESISSEPFNETQRDSGTDTNGVYPALFNLPPYLAAGARPLSVRIDNTPNVWSVQGADLLEDSFLIPGAPASLTINNTGDEDTQPPTLVSVTGFPASKDVTFGDETFNVVITVTDDLSGPSGGYIEGVVGGNYNMFGLFSAAHITGMSGSNVTYTVPVTVPADTPPGSYFIGIGLSDVAGNFQQYSDDPSQDWAEPIPPAGALKLTVINTSGTAPEIVVEQPEGSFLVDNTGSVNFGSIERGDSRSRTFTIRNTGDRVLSGIVVTKAGTNGADFTIDQPYSTSLPPGWHMDFTVQFSPGGAGARTGIIKVASNDADENPFEINVTGGTPLGPEIAVEQPVATKLSAGLSSIGYGSVATNASMIKAFTIRNLGNVPLLLDPMVVGTDPTSFSISTPAAASVAAGGSTTLAVKFAPTSVGAKTAILQIGNNDGNEAPFEIELTGDGTGSAGSFVLSAPYYEVDEAAGLVSVTVNRVGDSTGTVSVKVAAVNGTAVAVTDFTQIPTLDQTLTFDPAEVTKTISIPILNNTTPVETNEAFTVALTSIAGSVVGTPSTATVRIMDSGDDNASPTVAITTPALNGVVPETQSGFITVTGTATDDKGVSGVEVLVNGTVTVPATLTSATQNGTPATYTAQIAPTPGPNTIAVKSFDTKGSPNESAPLSRNFTYAVMRPLTVWISGSGTVANFFPTSQRQIGTSYTIVAAPAAGQVFAGWTHNGVANTGITPAKAEVASLTFTMQEGLELTANFTASPFIAEAGTYNGLVRSSLTEPTPPGSTTPSTSTEGFFTLKLETTGSFSGKLTIDGFVLNVNGLFDNDGKARFGTTRVETLVVARTGKPSLDVSLQLEDLDSPPFSGTGADRVTGTVTQKYRTVTTAVSGIVADRAVALNAFDSAIYAPGATTTLYTAIIEPWDHTVQPSTVFNGHPEYYAQGTGYATITLTKTGAVTFVGTLSDGTTPVSISSTVSKDLESPLFAQLYAKLGFISGLMKLNAAAPESDMSTGLDGMLWSRPYQDVQHYEYGWPEVITVDLEAAKYTAPTAGSSALAGLVPPANTSTANADISFLDKNSVSIVDKELSISTADVVSKIVADPKFTLTIVRTTGLFSGTFLRPGGDTVTSAYKGIIYQKGTGRGGYGYYLTPTPAVKTYDGESGAVKLVTRP